MFLDCAYTDPMTTPEKTQHDLLLMNGALLDAAATLRYWDEARQQHAADYEKTGERLRHAEVQVAESAANLRAAMAELPIAVGGELSTSDRDGKLALHVIGS